MLHCFLKTLQHLEIIDVETTLKEIIHRRFNDVLTIKQYRHENELCDWIITFDALHNFPIMLKNHERLIFIHPDYNRAKWAQEIVENELALKYEADLTDEEYPQQDIKPALKTHDTFLHYLEDITSHHSKTWQKAIILTELSKLPEALKAF